MPRKPIINWPARTHLVFTNGRGKVLLESSDRQLDLADTLMLHWSGASRTVYLSVATRAKGWEKWDEEALRVIEGYFQYDLNFDTYYVSSRRLTESKRLLPCSDPFQWRLHIREPRFSSRDLKADLEPTA